MPEQVKRPRWKALRMPGILLTVMPWDSSTWEKPRSTISSIMDSPSVWRLLFQQVEKASMGVRWDPNSCGGMGTKPKLRPSGLRVSTCAGGNARVSPRAMISRFSVLIVLAGLVCSCDKPAELVVTETRRLTTQDVEPKLHASSDERFRDMKPVEPGPVEGVTPEGWVLKPATEFRILNYGFGASGKGECWVTLASGGVLENVNRWMGQFSQAPIDEAALAGMKRVPVVGVEGVWVEVKGPYAGMGAGKQESFALAGIVADLGDRLLTVKMVGPEEEVAQARAQLEALAASLKFKP